MSHLRGFPANRYGTRIFLLVAVGVAGVAGLATAAGAVLAGVAGVTTTAGAALSLLASVAAGSAVSCQLETSLWVSLTPALHW